MGVVGDQVQRVRGLIPLGVLPALGRRRAASVWRDEEFRNGQLAEMRFLLERTERADEVETVARAFTEFSLLRNYRRWHPRHLARQPVSGAEWLTSKRDPDRGVLLSFLHHGQYEGLFSSLGRVGVALQTVVAPEAFDPASPIQLRQHFKFAGMDPRTTLVPASIGSAAMVDLVKDKLILAIASDVAGRTPVEFLGRTINVASGAARIATEANSPVVLVTSHRGPSGGPTLRVHEPLEPSDFADHRDLLQEMMRRHGEAVLAWPEASDNPYNRLVLSA